MLEAAASKHSRTKVKYQQIAEAVEKHKQKVLGTKSESLGNPRSFIKVCCNLLALIQQLFSMSDGKLLDSVAVDAPVGGQGISPLSRHVSSHAVLFVVYGRPGTCTVTCDVGWACRQGMF